MKKHLLALATGLLLGTTAATAQLHNWDNLPTLEEWPLEPYMREGVIIFYPLPNFELPGGKNAVAVRNIDRQWSTRYLRNPGDSANQFNWNHPGGGFIERLDINNDGFMDYLVGENIYYGRGEGLQPSPEPVRVGEHNFNGYFVDVNGDGLPDAVNGERLVIGNADFSKNREVRILPDSLLHKEYSQRIGRTHMVMYGSCWQAADGSVRYAVWYSDNSQTVGEPYHQTLCLYRLRYKGEVADLELLDRLESYGAENGINLPLSAVFQPEGVNGREFMFVLRGGARTEVYAIENDKWVYKERLPGPVTLLQGSIDQDTIRDLLIFDEATITLLAYSGKDLPALQPKSVVPLALNHAYIGDVNNDGIGDMGAIVDFPPQFQIILGKNTANSVSEPSIQNVHLYPNPADSIINVRSTIKHLGTYTYMLYRSTGELITTLGKSENIEGAIETSFDLRPLGLAPGAYILRLTGNGTFTDMQFIFGGK